jgi:hypothetical protein
MSTFQRGPFPFLLICGLDIRWAGVASLASFASLVLDFPF